MLEPQILALFQATGALLEGHFLLSSGLHSDKYLQCALVLQYPEYAERLGRALASHFEGDEIQVVAAPAMGGIIVAHEVARALGARAIFTEREGGRMRLRRGFALRPGERALVVEDVITTGNSTRETIEAIISAGGSIVAVGSLVDRSGGAAAVGTRRVSLLTLNVPAYDPANCPLCRNQVPIVKPGSRDLSP
jgi:orotate phosphoribosyltransferase